MGYYTQFSLHAQHKDGSDITPNEAAAIYEEIRSVTGISWYFSQPIETVEDINQFLGYERLKWYDCSADMTKISKKFPDIIFLITGNGEEDGDIWRHYFTNGNNYWFKARISFDDAKYRAENGIKITDEWG